MAMTSYQDWLPIVKEDEFLPPIGLWTQLGGLFLVGAVGVAFTLAAVIKYEVTIKGQANIRPAGELRLVQAPIEGPITQVYVRTNQVVRKGDTIARIDDSRLQTQKIQLQSSNTQNRLQLAQIQAQIEALDIRISADRERTHRTVASIEAELRRLHREYRDRQITSISEVEEAEAELKSARAALNAAQVKLTRYRPIAENGAISQERLEEAQLEVERQKQSVAAASARLQQVRATLNPSDGEVASATERIARERASGEASLATLQQEREALIRQRLELQTLLERDMHELEQVKLDLARTTITATADGSISSLMLRNSGQTVRPGETLAQIAPSDTDLVAKVLVKPGDIGRVGVGQRAQLRVSACPYPDFGTLKGFVSEISPDVIVQQRDSSSLQTTINSGNRNSSTDFFEVTVFPENLTLSHGNSQCSIQLGMEGRVDIITREETVLQFLLRKARLLTDI